jgi:hypothetical protein
LSTWKLALSYGTSLSFPIHQHGYEKTNYHVSFHVHEMYGNLNEILHLI